MENRILVGIGLLLNLTICGLSTSAAADAILVSDDREISVAATGFGCAIEDVVQGPPTPFAPYVDSLTLPADLGGSITAAQNTTVGTTAMGGTGSVSTTAGTSHFCGISTFSITFQLPTSMSYTFDGTLSTADNQTFGHFKLTGLGEHPKAAIRDHLKTGHRTGSRPGR
ncbi:MAG: hypothetical protein GY937_16520 [bacterium]|nr:hypothetical protein [bacterium]